MSEQFLKRQRQAEAQETLEQAKSFLYPLTCSLLALALMLLFAHSNILTGKNATLISQKHQLLEHIESGAVVHKVKHLGACTSA